MTEILKSPAAGSVGTTIPSHNDIIGPDLIAGENISGGAACYIATSGKVLMCLLDTANATAAVNEVQTININNNPTGGVITYGFRNQFTPELPYNANAATIQAALRALSTINGVNITVAGNYPTFTATFSGTLAGAEQEIIDAEGALLGADNTFPNVQVVRTTAGQPLGTGAIQGQSKVRGWATIPTRKNHPISLYKNYVTGYSDGNLVPGQDYYLSSTVPGGISDVATLTNQPAIAYAWDTVRLYLRSN